MSKFRQKTRRIRLKETRKRKTLKLTLLALLLAMLSGTFMPPYVCDSLNVEASETQKTYSVKKCKKRLKKFLKAKGAWDEWTSIMEASRSDDAVVFTTLVSYPDGTVHGGGLNLYTVDRHTGYINEN